MGFVSEEDLTLSRSVKEQLILLSVLEGRLDFHIELCKLDLCLARGYHYGLGFFRLLYLRSLLILLVR
jgi:hypothetical protein